MTTYLAERTQRVVVDGAISQEDRELWDVPQGTVLGPLLFLTYDNTINYTKGHIHIFADDALLYHPIKTECNGCVGQQGDFNSLRRWSDRWEIAFNATNVMFSPLRVLAE